MTQKQARTLQPDPAELRRAPRELVDFETHATGRGGLRTIRVVNISPLGLMARTDDVVTKGESVIFDLPHVRTVEAIIRWTEDGRIGTEFTTPIAAHDYAAMLSFMPRRQTAW